MLRIISSGKQIWSCVADLDLLDFWRFINESISQ